jgi:hypothetical protein
MSKILLAALLSSLLCVLWTATSWLALPWHDAAFRDFHDESAVATAIKGNAEDQLRRRNEKSGVFLLPRNALLGTPAPQPTEIDTLKATSVRKPVDNAIFAFVVVRPGAFRLNVIFALLWTFARSFAACFIISLMLSWTMRLDYLQRVVFCALGGIFASLVADAPLMTWLQMPLRYSITNFADHLCEWTLAGLAIAAMVEGREVWEKIR